MLLFTVVPAHVNGVRRSKEEMAAAQQYAGILLVEPMVVGDAKRHVLAARLIDHTDQHRRGVLYPLFDVRLVKMTEGGLLLQGYQIESIREGEELVCSEYVQGWWAKFVMP
ncbi:hypothetical protein [Rhodoferax sp. GW822-FHT02A01]|uniref:hypothetical protein n=1 Tax=Rhodoferax sp. GW822-FHT02A01 TaxID=3141537 RepID=UPI00315CA21E